MCIEAEEFRPRERHGLDGFFPRHAAAHGEGGTAQHPAAVSDGIVGVNGGEHAALLQFRTVAPVNVAGFEFSAGGVQQDDGAGRARGGDFAGDFPCIGDVVEHHLKAELLTQPEDSEDVVGAVRVMMHHAFAKLQHANRCP